MATDRSQIQAYIQGILEGLGVRQDSFIDDKQDPKIEGQREALAKVLAFIEKMGPDTSSSGISISDTWMKPLSTKLNEVQINSPQNPIWTTTGIPPITCKNEPTTEDAVNIKPDIQITC